MRVIVEGQKRGRKTRITYDLLDRYDAKTGATSMARTTGYSATVAARMLAAGIFGRKGDMIFALALGIFLTIAIVFFASSAKAYMW